MFFLNLFYFNVGLYENRHKCRRPLSLLRLLKEQCSKSFNLQITTFSLMGILSIFTILSGVTRVQYFQKPNKLLGFWNSLNGIKNSFLCSSLGFTFLLMYRLVAFYSVLSSHLVSTFLSCTVSWLFVPSYLPIRAPHFFPCTVSWLSIPSHLPL